MRPNDAYDHFESTFSYPIDREEVMAATGDTTVEAPTGDDESIEAILDRCDETTFESPRELHETFLAQLGEAYIGRKFYDDRGRNFGPGEIRRA